MPFTIIEVKTREEFKTVIPVFIEAHHNPYNPFMPILLGESEEGFLDRQWSFMQAFPGCRWIKVVDDESGEVVAASNWLIFHQNPYTNGPPSSSADWWPEGSAMRQLSEQMIHSLVSQRAVRQQRPHVHLNILFVAESWRRRGVGALMMKWGRQVADDLGFEIWIESTRDGKPLYEYCGFKMIHAFAAQTHETRPSAEFAELQQKMVPEPFPLWHMWRPAYGKIDPLKPYPWEG